MNIFNSAITVVVTHFSFAFATGWLITGSAFIGGILALIAPVMNAFCVLDFNES